MTKRLVDALCNIPTTPTPPNVNKQLLEALVELDQACISDFSFKYPGGTHEVVQQAIAAAQTVVEGLEMAFECDTEEKRWAFHDLYNKFPEVAIDEAARLQLARQKDGEV